MEIVIVILWFGISGICIFLGLQINNLKSTVKNQQVQIDELNRFIINRSESQDKINKGMLEIYEHIANKVIRIEEKVDSDSERIKTLEMEINRMILYL